MKITKKQLEKLVKESIASVLEEDPQKKVVTLAPLWDAFQQGVEKLLLGKQISVTHAFQDSKSDPDHYSGKVKQVDAGPGGYDCQGIASIYFEDGVWVYADENTQIEILG